MELRRGVLDERELQCFEIRKNQFDRLAREQSKVRRHLIVPASAGVKFQSNRPDLLCERCFDEGVDVLIRHRLDFVGRVLAENAFEAAIDRLPLFFVEDAGAEETPGVSAAGAHIDFEKNSIDRQRSIHLFEDGVLLLFKPSLPEFHIFRDRARDRTDCRQSQEIDESLGIVVVVVTSIEGSDVRLIQAMRETCGSSTLRLPLYRASVTDPVTNSCVFVKNASSASRKGVNQ